MYSLPPPVDQDGDPFVTNEVFELCISNMNPGARLTALQSLADTVVDSSEDYQRLAMAKTLHQFPRTEVVAGVSIKKRMIKVYDDKFAKAGQPARKIYDKIFAAAKKLCPLCGLGHVKTLDHHLPKAEYPLLSVTPENLLPSCYWCQGAKKKASPKSEGEQTLHPYYDNYDVAIWLKANVVQGTSPCFVYFVDVPAGWTQIVAKRLNHHLVSLDLGELFTQRATIEANDIKGYLGKLFAAGGRQHVRQYLSDQIASLEANSLNGWRVAMYVSVTHSTSG